MFPQSFNLLLTHIFHLEADDNFIFQEENDSVQENKSINEEKHQILPLLQHIEEFNSRNEQEEKFLHLDSEEIENL